MIRDWTFAPPLPEHLPAGNHHRRHLPSGIGLRFRVIRLLFKVTVGVIRVTVRVRG